MFRRLAYSYVLVVAAEFLSRLLNFFVHRGIALHLGSDGLGLLGAVNAVLLMGFAVANFGQEAIFLREAGKRRQDYSGLLGSTILLRLVTGVIAAVAVNVVVRQVPGYGAIVPYVLLASGALILHARMPFRQVFDVEVNTRWPAALRIGRAAVNLVVVLTLLRLGFGVATVIIIGVLLDVVEGWAWKRGSEAYIRPRWRVDLQEWLSLLREGSWLLLPQMFITIYSRVDQLFLLTFGGPRDVGYYEVAMKLTELMIPLSMLAMQLLLPLLTRVSMERPHLFTETYTIVFRLVATMVLPICLIVTWLAPDILVLLYREEYLASTMTLRILVWSLIWVFLGVVNNGLLVVIGRQKLDLALTGSNLIVNIVLNLLLIPRYGPAGAALATTISYSAGIVAGLYFRDSRPLSMALLASLRGPVIGALAAAGVGGLVGEASLVVVLGTLIITYGLIQWLAGGSGPGDLLRLRSLRAEFRSSGGS